MSLVVSCALLDAWLGEGWFIGGPWALLGAAAAGYLLGAWYPPRWCALAVAGAAVGLTVANQRLQSDEFPIADDLVFFLLAVGAPAVAGAALSRGRAQIADLAELGRRLQEQRLADLEAARLEERERVETGVHRRLIEQVGAVVLLAEGARSHPGAPTISNALSAIEDAARAALMELRGAVGTLRTTPEPSSSSAPEPPSGAAGLTQAPPGLRDVALTVGIGAAIAIESVVRHPGALPAWVGVVAAVMAAAPVVWRRTIPFVVLASTGGLSATITATLTPLPLYVTTLALLVVTAYAAGAYGRRMSVALGLAWAVPAAQVFALPSDQRDLEGLLPTLVLATLAVLAGRVAAGAARRAATLEYQVAALERGREIEHRAAVAATRLELARALHDCVAQAMTIACLQSSAARLPGADPDAALVAVLATARECMAELRDRLDELDDPASAFDRPALDRLAASGGLDVAWSVDPALEPTGPVAALLRQVLREALTNAARHATGSRVRVRIERLPGDRIEVEVVDDGTGHTQFDLGSRTGLAGLRESLAAHGGTLTAGPRPEGGFRLTASLPAREEVHA